MTRKKKLLLIAAGILLFVFIAWTVMRALAFTSRPYFCQYCHAMKKEYKSWKQSPHKDVNCLNCHQEPGPAGTVVGKLQLLKEFNLWLTNLYQRPITTQVKNKSCLRCHQKEVKQILTSQGIIVSHEEFTLQEYYWCTDCHNTVAHGKAVPVPQYGTMDKCVGCHDGEKAGNDCNVCHTTKVERTRARNKNSQWAITHSKEWEKTHGMGDLSACQVCHSGTDCASCHQMEMPHSESFPQEHAKLAKQDRKRCIKCHHEDFCISCHRTEIPHPKDFLKNHSREAKKRTRTSCLRCHVEYECEECHVKHVHPGLTPEQLKQLEETVKK